MNIEPPGALDWLLLIVVGALAGAVNALKSYSERGPAQRLILGAVEGATALFVTIVSFLVLHSVLPTLTGIQLPSLGAIGLSGMVAHLGLRKTIRLVHRMTDGASKD